MANDYVLTKLVSALDTMSDSDLRRLAAVLSQPQSGKAVAGMLENTLALRRAQRDSERKHRSRPKGPATRRKASRRDNGEPVQVSVFEGSTISPREAFFEKVNDRGLFPGTYDVVATLNAAFSTAYQYDDFRKSGRKPLARQCWRHLMGLPEKKRLRLLRAFFDTCGNGLDKSDEYRELFRILTRNG